MLQTTPAVPALVQTPEVFSALVRDLKGRRRIAVDTESNSLHAYRERVCLIQFSTDLQDYVLDALALDGVGMLAEIFENAGIEKIFHAAEYDILCLRRDFRLRLRQHLRHNAGRTDPGPQDGRAG